MKLKRKLTVRDAVKLAGGLGKVSALCGVSKQAVDKWIQNQKLPRTEYTNETKYAEVMADASEYAFLAEDLKASLLSSDS